jgi:hypothetical protein
MQDVQQQQQLRDQQVGVLLPCRVLSSIDVAVAEVLAC